MSSSDERNARSPAAKSVQRRACSRSNHEHYQKPMQRNDGTAAMREVVPEGSVGPGRTGSPSPGGGQQDQPIHGTGKKIWNKCQQAPGAASRAANPGASMQVPNSVEDKPAEARDQGYRSQGPPPAMRRTRVPPQRFASNIQVSACEWKRSMGLVCMSDCNCENSVPRQEEERASRVRGLDNNADSWGVIANRDIQYGEVITIFGGTTYLNGSERVGADFGQLHERLHEAGEPLQYTLQGCLAESSKAKIWAIPEPDKEVIRGRRDVKTSLRRALGKGGEPGIGQWINHTCCDAHCNAEFQLTRALAGDP